MVKRVAAIFSKQNSLAAASVILMVTLALSNVLGVIRDHFLTQKIPTDLLSVYYAAFRIPDTIFNVLILGAIASAFIPTFTSLITQKKEAEAWQVASSIVNIAFISLVAFSGILAVFMPMVAPHVVPGFDRAHLQLTVMLARIMLLSPIFFGLSYIFGGILNSYKRFLVYSLAPLVYNLTIICGTLFFANRFGVMGVAIAVVVGAFLHFLIQLPVALKLGFRFHFKIRWDHGGVRRIGLLMVPRALALGANQIMLLVFTGIASALGGYSIAVYTLADNIQTMPMVVFGTSFSTAIFPVLAEAISQNRHEDFNAQIKKFMRIILFFMVPMIVILILLRMQIVRLIFGSGNFGWEQTIATANTLAYLATSLIFTGLTPLFSRAFYALHNTRIPMIVTLVSVAISIALGKILSLSMGVEGLALGYSIGAMVNTVVLYIILRVKMKIPNEIELFWFSLKVLAATVVMVVAMQWTKVLADIFVDMQRFWGVATQTLIAVVIGLLVYGVITWLLGCEEIKAFEIIWQKFARKNIINTET